MWHFHLQLSECRQEDKRFWTDLYQSFPNFNLLLIPLQTQFSFFSQKYEIKIFKKAVSFPCTVPLSSILVMRYELRSIHGIPLIHYQTHISTSARQRFSVSLHSINVFTHLINILSMDQKIVCPIQFHSSCFPRPPQQHTLKQS